MSYLRGLTLRFALVVFLALTACLAVTSHFASQSFENALLPEIEGKAFTLARNQGSLLARAAMHDISLKEMVGVQALFSEVQHENPEIGVLAVSSDAGEVLHLHGDLDAAFSAYLEGKTYQVQAPDLPGAAPVPEAGGQQRQSAPRGGRDPHIVSVPIVADGAVKGYLHVGTNAGYVRAILRENLMDGLVVLVVAFFIAIEMIHFFCARSVLNHVGNLMYTMAGACGGNFDRRLASATLRALSPVALAVNDKMEAVNAAYTRLLCRVRDAIAVRHAPALAAISGAAAQPGRAERQRVRQRVRDALRGLRALRGRYRFGSGAAEDAAARLGLVRAPLFLFLLAEDLSRSFMPAYSAALFTPVPGVSLQFVLGLPIMLFMLVVALSQPTLGGWTERVGRRRALLVGAFVGALAHLAAAFAFSLYDLLLWRAAAGLAWGIVFVAGQGYVLDHTDIKTRTRGLAFFVGVIMVASACGPSIGGIFAEAIGYRPTLLLAALLAAAAAWLVHAHLQDVARTGPAAVKPRAADFSALLRNRRFVVFLVSAAMPAKIILIASCFYLIPLYMPQLGSNVAMAGRLIMLYAVVMVVGVPFAARWSGVPARRWVFVTAGLLLSGVAGLMPLLLPGVYGVMALVLVLGAAQSLSIAPQTAMVGPICRIESARLGEGTVLGIYRLIERIGNALGPLIGAALLLGMGYAETFAALGVMLLLCAAVFGFTFAPAAAARLPAALTGRSA